MIVVGLSVIVVNITLLVPILATRVIGASIEALLVLRRVVPSMVSLLLSIPSDELHYRIVAKIAALYEIRVQFRESTVQIALRADVRQASLNAPVSIQQTCAKAERLLMRIVRTTTQIQREIRFQAYILSLHIQRSTKGTCTVG